MKTIFEKSVPGRQALSLPECDVPLYQLSPELLREKPLRFPEVAEIDLVRHYTALSKRAYGVDDGFYPLGSCTMKYNPKLNEEAANLPGFTGIHPLQEQKTLQGALKLMYTLGAKLAEITGMDQITLQPAAGAHGEYTALQLIRAYHLDHGNPQRNKIIVLHRKTRHNYPTFQQNANHKFFAQIHTRTFVVDYFLYAFFRFRAGAGIFQRRDYDSPALFRFEIKEFIRSVKSARIQDVRRFVRGGADQFR